MKLQNKKSLNERIGEQRLIQDELLLDWSPEGAQEFDIPLEAMNFIQKDNKSENDEN